MKNHSLLLRWLSAFALAACLVASRGVAAQIKMSIGWDPPTNDHPYAVAGNDFKRRVEQYTNGQIQVQTYCCFKMGSEEEMVKKLQLGTLDATIVAQNNVGPAFRL